MGEASPMAIALVGVIGGILVCMIGLLISMVSGVRRELREREESYKADRKEIVMKLDDHGDRILVLEVRIKNEQP